MLVFDESTAGVDVALRQQLWDYVQTLSRAGTTVVLTTCYLQEAKALCDRIAILAGGEIRADDTTEALLRRVENEVLTIELASPLTAVPDALRPFGPVLAGPQQLVLRYGQGVSRDWGDADGSDMTGRAAAGWGIVDGSGIAADRDEG